MTVTALKKRFNGHSPLNDVIRKDWQLAIELSPDNFQALLYKPKLKEWYNEEQSTYQEDLVTEIDSNQDELEYQTPFAVYVVDCPDENPFFMTMNGGDAQLGDYATPLLLRIATDSVPIGSILEWEEEIATNEHRRCWWYVHSQQGMGTANVGTLYVCIPARNFDGLAVDNEQVMDAQDLGYDFGFGFDTTKDMSKILDGQDLGYELGYADPWGDHVADNNFNVANDVTEKQEQERNANELKNDVMNVLDAQDLGYDLGYSLLLDTDAANLVNDISNIVDSEDLGYVLPPANEAKND